MNSLVRYFATSILITALAVIVAGVSFGPAAIITTVILIAIEVAFSFDNAIVNAKVLERLSEFWQQLFLTLGVIVAIIGMRLVFPILIVVVTAHSSWSEVLDDALHHPKIYAQHLESAHAAISAFGGSFLLTLAFYFLFDDARKELWLKRLESKLQKIGGSIWLPPLFSSLIIVALAFFAGDKGNTIFSAGLLGAFSYMLIKLFIDGLGKLSGAEAGKAIYRGWGAFGAFMYLQLLDASFSFDGVLGAFAITDKVLLIALGLGVGAIWVRSLTVFMVRRGTLKAYIYLEHGAHYAILALAVALLASLYINLSDIITGIVGLGIIGASYLSSVEAKRASS